MPTAAGVSKKKFDDCVDQVSKKGNVDNAYAVCNASLSKNKEGEKDMPMDDEKKKMVPDAKADGAASGGGEVPPKKEEAGEEAPAQDGAGHEDEKSDLQLLQKIISQAIGEDHKDDESVHAATKEAYEAYKEMGLSEEDAQAKAGDALKLAKHRAEKKSKEADCGMQKESEDSAKKQIPAMSDKSGGESELLPEMKESNTKLVAENARLKEEIKKMKIDNVLETVCKESGLAVGVTKIFKEHVRALRLTDETKIKEKMKEFKEEFQSVNQENDSKEGSSNDSESPFAFVISTEKSSGVSPIEGSTNGFDF